LAQLTFDIERTEVDGRLQTLRIEQQTAEQALADLTAELDDLIE
jgi:hypothetical protein